MKRKMDVFGILVAIITGVVVMCLIIVLGLVLDLPLWLIILAGIVLGGVIGCIVGRFLPRRREITFDLDNLPAFAGDYIKLVIQYMGYRRNARQEVADELTDHFEAALKDCINEQEKQKIANHIIEQFGDAKLLAVLMRRAKKRCRPLWRTAVARTFQGIGILLILLIIYIAWFITGKPVITTDYVAELNKLVRPSADDSLNAAPLYTKAIESLVDFNDVTELLKSDFNDANDSQKELIRQWLAKNETSLALVAKGSELPYYWKRYHTKDPNGWMFGVLVPELSTFLTISHTLCWRAWLNAENGRYDSAFKDIEISYRLGSHIKGNKILIEQIYGMAIQGRAIGTTRWLLDSFKMDSNVLADFQQSFQQLIDIENFGISLQSEKLLMYDVIQRVFTESRFGHSHLCLKTLSELNTVDGVPKSDKSIYGLLAEIVTEIVKSFPNSEVPRIFLRILFTHPNKAESIASANAFYEFWDDMNFKTPAQLKAEDVNVADEIEHLTGKNLILSNTLPALGRIHLYAWRFKIDAESTLVCIALVRYKQDTGGYPETLDKLAEQGYIKQIPIDPFSDKPIAYRKTNGDFLLYSFGENLKDDGGQVVRGNKGKMKPIWEQLDWVFWPVEKN
jgi:uncharacterized protein YneF (UPF0154 family)